MKPCHVFAAMSGSSAHSTHEPKTVQLVHQQLHIAHVLQHHSNLLQQQKVIYWLKRKVGKLHLLKVLENAKQ